ncbi:MAG: MMPL family transporter, partial [FCB group bacterium]|nr:MMPL family transporter [FCB group bacterium]
MKNTLLNQILKRPGRLIFLAIFFTAILGLGIQWIHVEDDLMSIISDDMESKKSWDAILEEFGSMEIIFLAIGNRDATIYEADLFADVYDLSQELENDPVIDEVISLSTVNRMDADDGFIDVKELQPERDLTGAQISSIRQYLDTHPDIQIRIVSKNQDYANVIIRPLADIDNNTFRNHVVEIVEKYRDKYEIHLGGHAYLTGTVPMLIRQDVMTLMRFGLLIMVVILLINLRSPAAVGMVMAVIGLSLVAMLGAMGWIYRFTGSENFYFTLMNTAMPIILLTIANSDGVHILAKFFREFRKTGDKEKAIRTTTHSLAMPVFLTSLTTGAAFLSMISSPIKQMIGFGICISIGIIWALILSMTLLPALIMLKKWKLTSRALTHASLFERAVSSFGENIVHRPKTILIAGLTVVLICAFGLTRLVVEVDFVKFFKPGNEIRDSIEFIDRELTGTMDIQIRVSGDIKDPAVLETMQGIQDFLELHPQVSTSISIVDVIKQMHRTVMDDDPAFEVIPDSREKVNNLFTLYSMSGDPDDFTSLVDYEYSAALITALMGNIPTSEVVKYADRLDDYIAENVGDHLLLTITGMEFIIRDMVFLVIQSAVTSIIASILLIFIIIWIFFRRPIWGVLAVIPLSSAVI